MKIKKGDTVVVISGDEAASAPRTVTEVLEGGQKVVVEGVNVVQRHVKRGHPKSPQGGRLRFEKAIQASNVMYYCDACKKPVRIGFRLLPDGSKERFCRACNASAGKVSPARK
jgi:large subunit ribosomal protein L24